MQRVMFVFVMFLFLAACHSAPKSDLRLNNGEKWAVNAEMKPHIEQGSKILDDFLAQNGADHKKLAADLKTQNDLLIKSCNMKGESHDELHKWLHPHMELIAKLGETSDPKEAEPLVAKLEQSFKTYQNYFQ